MKDELVHYTFLFHKNSTKLANNQVERNTFIVFD